jgi:hypothetical protein
MTDLARTRSLPSAVAAPPVPVLPTLAAGVVGGCALGCIARAWMRLIAEDPEFTWSGTLFIVAGFTIFGFGQSIVAVARQRLRQRSTLTIVRTFGVVAMVPLFGAAGAVMLPTVVGGGLAVARTEWHPAVRGLCLLAATAPVLLVGNDLLGSFGWSLHSLAGFVLMLAIYSIIIRATRFAFSARRNGPHRR